MKLIKNSPRFADKSFETHESSRSNCILILFEISLRDGNADTFCNELGLRPSLHIKCITKLMMPNRDRFVPPSIPFNSSNHQDIVNKILKFYGFGHK